MVTSRQRLEELLKLSREERSDIAEALLESLEGREPEPESAAAWADEIGRRVERNDPGTPAEQVFAEGRARLEPQG